jgi:p-cumate 2,3-dioxygenase subunit alpha
LADALALESLIHDDTEQGVFRVHRSTMTRPDILDLEWERIFARCWLFVGHESEVPDKGDYVRREIAQRPLIFVRGADDVVRVLFNTCTHRGARVCRQERGNASSFQCFYHAWTFRNTGELAGVPDEAGYSDAFRKEDMGLQAPPQVDSYRGFVFMSLDPEIESLKDYLAGATEYLDLIIDQSEAGMRVVQGQQIYATRANWKLLVENSIDGYHTVPLHKSYFQFLASLGDDMSGNVTGDDALTYNLGNGHAAGESKAPFGRPVAVWHPLFGEDAKEDIAEIRARLIERWGEERAMRMAENQRLLQIFPNLYVHDIAAITIRQFWPVSPDYLVVNAWALAPSEEPAHLLKRRLESFNTFLGPGGLATPDDVEALESCQDGFAATEVEWSDISRGMKNDRPRFVDEVQMRAFWREWHARMQGQSHANHTEALRTHPAQVG